MYIHVHLCAYMCTFFLVVAFRDARFLSGLYGRFSYIVIAAITESVTNTVVPAVMSGIAAAGGAVPTSPMQLELQTVQAELDTLPSQVHAECKLVLSIRVMHNSEG